VTLLHTCLSRVVANGAECASRRCVTPVGSTDQTRTAPPPDGSQGRPIGVTTPQLRAYRPYPKGGAASEGTLGGVGGDAAFTHGKHRASAVAGGSSGSRWESANSRESWAHHRPDHPLGAGRGTARQYPALQRGTRYVSPLAPEIQQRPGRSPVRLVGIRPGTPHPR
jgi:hypothetical protein